MNIYHYLNLPFHPSATVTINPGTTPQIWNANNWEVTLPYGETISVAIKHEFKAPALDEQYFELTIPEGRGDILIATNPVCAYPNPDNPDEWVYKFKWGAACYTGSPVVNLNLLSKSTQMMDLQSILDSLTVDFLDSEQEAAENFHQFANQNTANSTNTISFGNAAAASSLLIWSSQTPIWKI